MVLDPSRNVSHSPVRSNSSHRLPDNAVTLSVTLLVPGWFYHITKHRPQTNKPARMRNRNRETIMKWVDRSTLFPDGSRLMAPVRSQHHDVCGAHASRETTGMTTDHFSRSPDTPPGALASDPHVGARREGEAFCLQPDTPVSSCPLARSNCARKPDSNQLLPPPPKKKKEEQTTTVQQRLWFPEQPRHMARFDTWLHQTAQLLQTVTFRPKTAHCVSHVTRETCFVNTSATLFALSTFCSRNRPVDTQDSITTNRTSTCFKRPVP